MNLGVRGSGDPSEYAGVTPDWSPRYHKCWQCESRMLQRGVRGGTAAVIVIPLLEIGGEMPTLG